MQRARHKIVRVLLQRAKRVCIVVVGVRLQNQILFHPSRFPICRIPLILQCNFGLQFAAAPKPAFKSASWEEQEPPLPKELINRTDDHTNWSSFDSSVNPSDDKIATEADPWAQAEIKEEIHTARAVDVQMKVAASNSSLS